MKPNIPLIIVIPVGPACRQDFLEDTLESIRYYISCRYRIIIADDSQCGLGKRVKGPSNNVHVLESGRNLGKVAGLYTNLSRAYQYALEQFDFELLLKMDDDALVTGADPQESVRKFFSEHPEVGMAGRYIHGQLSADSYGNIHDNYWPRKQLLKDTCSWKIIRRPLANWTLRKVFFRALRNGYELGENVQGGAYFMSYTCLKKLTEEGLLSHPNLGRVNFGEDLLFSLLTRAAGFTLGDISAPGQPVGCAWKGLPASPQRLHADDKKIIHSIRFWQDMDELAVRQFFREKRAWILSYDAS